MRRPTLAPYIVLAASLLLTIVATLLVAASARDRDRARFENAVQSTQDLIRDRLDTYVALLRGGSALFAASEEVSRADFRAYVDRLDVRRRYPGIQGIGFSLRVPPGTRDSLVSAVRAEGLGDFRIWPEGEREQVHSIVYLAPLDARNRAVLGFDMFSEPTRRATMERARDTGAPALTGKVRLKQEIDERVQAGFLIYVPVYRGGNVPSTVAERRSALRGFVYSPFRADDLFAGIFGTERNPRVAFRVYDGAVIRPDNLLHDSGSGSTGRPDSPEFTATTTLETAGRVWTLTFASLPAFEAASDRSFVPGIATLGLLASLVLFAVTRSEAKARDTAERTAEEAAELATQLQKQALELEQQVEESQALNEELEATNNDLVATMARAEHARAEAEHANRAKADFLAAMSHELRTPLNAIAGYAELMEMGLRGPVTDAQRSDLDRIRRSQQHLLSLINDILNFAKLEAGSVEFRIADVPLWEVLVDLRAMTEPQLIARGVVHHFHLPDRSLAARGEADKVQQILLNLLTNAIKFTDPGGRVSVAAEADGEWVRIQVRDTGRGIAADRLDDIFDPFVQVERHLTQSSQQGVGLGLAISRELARGMGGELAVESRQGEGSTFTLTLSRGGPVGRRD